MTSGDPEGKVPAILWIRVASNASSNDIGGRIDGNRCASIVLPVPGGPTKSKLCPPAAATSNARRAESWPLTSARSGNSPKGAASKESTSTISGCAPFSPRKSATASARLTTPYTATPTANAASQAFSCGTIIAGTPALRASSAIGSTPRNGRTVPSRPSSPSTIRLASFAASTPPWQAMIPSAIGKSKAAPSFLRSPGASEMIETPNGGSCPLDASADQTRWRLSRIAVSGSPTIVTLVSGPPPRTSTSTSTRKAFTPCTAALRVLLNMDPPYSSLIII